MFLGLAVIFGGGGLFLGRFSRNEIVSNLESRLALKDERIAEYERFLDGASPDEARYEIDQLKQQVEAIAHALKRIESYDKSTRRPVAFVTFDQNLRIVRSFNVAGISDDASNRIGVNFDVEFPDDLDEAKCIGPHAPQFKVEHQSVSGVEIRFSSEISRPVSLYFDHLGLP